MRTQLEERFWSKVVKGRSCWVWNGATASGYGRIKVGGKAMLAHRVIFLMRGINPGKVVMHTCDNPRCVNPDHLIPGVSQVENMEDAYKKGRVSVPGGGRITEKECRSCKKTLPVSSFTPYSCPRGKEGRSFGYRPWCKQCRAKRKREGKTY